MNLAWNQWLDDRTNMLYAFGGTNTEGAPLMVALWEGEEDGAWLNQTPYLVPDERQPNEMEQIAMWSEIPDLDLALLEKQRKCKTDTSASSDS